MNKIIWNEDKWAKFVIAVDKAIEIMDSHCKGDDIILDMKEWWQLILKRMEQSETKTYNFWVVKNNMINKNKIAILWFIKDADRELGIYSLGAMSGWWY